MFSKKGRTSPCSSKCSGSQSSNTKIAKPLILSLIKMKQFIILTSEQLKEFIDEHQIVYCVQLMDMDMDRQGQMADGLDYAKLAKLYYYLFQVWCASASANGRGSKEVIGNFLVRYQFGNKLGTSQIPVSVTSTQKILIKKLANFLDSFKTRIDPIIQINSLISQYHQYRFVSFSSFSQICPSNSFSFSNNFLRLLQKYLTQNFSNLFLELERTDWETYNQQKFQEFYQFFSEICSICKRAQYVKDKCGMEIGVKMGQTIREAIQSRKMQIQKDKIKQSPKQIRQEPIPERQQQKVSQPVHRLNIKKKLKSINSLIIKMEVNGVSGN